MGMWFEYIWIRYFRNPLTSIICKDIRDNPMDWDQGPYKFYKKETLRPFGNVKIWTGSGLPFIKVDEPESAYLGIIGKTQVFLEIKRWKKGVGWSDTFQKLKKIHKTNSVIKENL